MPATGEYVRALTRGGIPRPPDACASAEPSRRGERGPFTTRHGLRFGERSTGIAGDVDAGLARFARRTVRHLPATGLDRVVQRALRQVGQLDRRLSADGNAHGVDADALAGVEPHERAIDRS